MSRRLPGDVVYMIYQYLPISQIAALPLPTYFWLRRIANEAEVSENTVIKVKDNNYHNNISRIGAYFHVLLPGADCYVSPFECYLSMLNDDNVQKRIGYLEQTWPNLSDRNSSILAYIAFMGLKNKNLIRDIEYIYYAYSYLRPNLHMRDVIYLMYTPVLEESSHLWTQLSDKILNFSKLRVTKDIAVYFHNLISGGQITQKPDQIDNYDFLMFAAQFGREDLFPLVRYLDINVLIAGYLKSNNVAQAIACLQQMDAADFTFYILLYTDSLEFYQALEQLYADKNKFYFETCLNTVSWINKKIFRYAFDRVTLAAVRFIINSNDGTINEYFLLKSSDDFQGFQMMWHKFLEDKQLLRRMRQTIGLTHLSLVSNEAKVLFLFSQ